MKGAEIAESGWYWFTPNKDSPPSWGAAPVVVYVSAVGDGRALFGCLRYSTCNDFMAERVGGNFVGPLTPPMPPQPTGCRRKLAAGQWWGFCGETDMGQSLPALCTECGGDLKLATPATP